jgi:hypothetical protein
MDPIAAALKSVGRHKEQRKCPKYQLCYNKIAFTLARCVPCHKCPDRPNISDNNNDEDRVIIPNNIRVGKRAIPIDNIKLPDQLKPCDNTITTDRFIQSKNAKLKDSTTPKDSTKINNQVTTSDDHIHADRIKIVDNTRVCDRVTTYDTPKTNERAKLNNNTIKADRNRIKTIIYDATTQVDQIITAPKNKREFLLFLEQE